MNLGYWGGTNGIIVWEGALQRVYRDLKLAEDRSTTQENKERETGGPTIVELFTFFCVFLLQFYFTFNHLMP